MIDVDEAVRAAVRDLADEGRPVDLGDRALAGVRRKTRRSRALTAVGVAAVAAGVLAWPQWVTRDGRPAVTPPGPSVVETPPTPAPATPSAPPSALALEPWPTFAGLPTVPAAPPETAAGRLVVAAYTTYPAPTGPAIVPASVGTYLLDPTTGRYRLSNVDNALAFSPDLRYALVTRQHEISEPGSGATLGIAEYGIYDTVAGRIRGQLNVEAWVPPLGDRVVWDGSWSPDGRSIVLGVRKAIQGRGWLAEKLIFIDVLTGGLRAVDISPTQGLEPLELLGWTRDSLGIALAAGRIGTGEAPRGHVLYDLNGRPISVHSWPGQRNAIRVINADQLLLMPIGPDEIAVMGLSTGAVQHRYPTQPVSTLPGWELPLGWRDGTLIYRSQACTADGCTDGPQVFGVSPDTGQSRTLYTLAATVRHVVLAPGGGLTGKAAQLTW